MDKPYTGYIILRRENVRVVDVCDQRLRRLLHVYTEWIFIQRTFPSCKYLHKRFIMNCYEREFSIPADGTVEINNETMREYEKFWYSFVESVIINRREVFFRAQISIDRSERSLEGNVELGRMLAALNLILAGVKTKNRKRILESIGIYQIYAVRSRISISFVFQNWKYNLSNDINDIPQNFSELSPRRRNDTEEKKLFKCREIFDAICH